MKLRRTGALIGAAVTLGVTATFGAAPADAATRSITAQSTYFCQAHAPGEGNSNYKVTLRMQLDVPTTAMPGTKITLGGIVTMQFDQRLYESSKNYGIRSVEGYSTTLSTTSSTAGTTTIIRANRFQTSPSPVSDPIVVSAPISFPDYTVPSDAAKEMTLGLPANGTTPNPVSSSPSSVAFTVYANADAGLATFRVTFACYMKGSPPGTLGKIPIATRSVPESAQSTATPAAQQGGSPTTTASAVGTTPTTGTTALDNNAGAPAESLDGKGSGQSGQSTVPPVAPTPAALPAQPTEDRSGVYVPTGLLVFGGAAICMVSIVYAAVTNARLRMIKRSLEG